MELKQQIYQLIIASRIDQAIQDKNWSLETAVKKCKTLFPGMSLDKAKLSRICNANYEPKYLETYALCQVLGLKLDELIPNEVSASFLQTALERIQREIPG